MKECVYDYYRWTGSNDLSAVAQAVAGAAVQPAQPQQQQRQQRRAGVQIRHPISASREQAIPIQIFSLNASYFVYFFAKMFGPLPGPRELNETCQVWGAYGTTATCTAQGFFIQLGTWSIAFHLVTLVSLYVLMVKREWREHQLRPAVVFMSISVWIVCLLMAIAGLPLKLFNFKDQNCYINVYPAGCNKDNSCTRGGNAAYVYGWIVKSPYFFVVALMIVLFISIIKEVRRVEDRVHRYASGSICFDAGPSTLGLDAAGATEATGACRCGSQPNCGITENVECSRNDDYPSSQNHGTVTASMISASFPVPVDRSKSKAVALQAVLLAGYSSLVVFVIMFEMFSPLFLGYRDYSFHLLKTCVDNLQGFVFFIIFARPRVGNTKNGVGGKGMITREGQFMRTIVFIPCFCYHRWHTASTQTSSQEPTSSIEQESRVANRATTIISIAEEAPFQCTIPSEDEVDFASGDIQACPTLLAQPQL